MVPLLDSREVMFVMDKINVDIYLTMFATVTLTRSASSHCTSNTEKASPTRTVDGFTSMRD